MTAAYLDRIMPDVQSHKGHEVDMHVTVDRTVSSVPSWPSEPYRLGGINMNITVLKPPISRRLPMPEPARRVAPEVVPKQPAALYSARRTDVQSWLSAFPHEATYGKLDILELAMESETECRIVLAPTEDQALIGAVDLHLSRAAARCDPPRLNSVLSGIEVYKGGRRVDAVCGPDIETHVASCAILRKDPRRWGFFGSQKGLVVPLAMEPFYADAATPCGTRDGRVEVRLQFCEGVPRKVMESATLYGMRYKPLTHMHGAITQRVVPSHTRSVAVDLTSGAISVSLDFIKPGRYRALLFWGVDKARVMRVALSASGRCVYDGPLAMLEYHKRASGLRELKACCMMFDGCTGAAAGLRFDGQEHANALTIEVSDAEPDDGSDEDCEDGDRGRATHVTVMAIPCVAEHR